MAKKIFHGKVITAGEYKGNLVKSDTATNIFTSVVKSLDKKTIIASNKNNSNLFNKQITAKAICISSTVANEACGLLLNTLIKNNNAPSALLFANEANTNLASSLLATSIVCNNTIIAIENLGNDFMNFINENMILHIKSDGTVIAETPTALALASKNI